ncbi:ParB N-terminal domain-containing protein [Pendulispora brunnea]|uniref:Methyltransferase n=1 Tax=Pendulispora brunnea TaxID=2905690 RepID=A0ABZ2K797_9BACT
MNEPAAEWVPLDRIRPWKDNPRKNDGAPVEKVAQSIRRFGFGAPILARTNGEIIAGHTRWKAAKDLGLERVPVRFLELDPADAHLLAVADNRIGEEAEWDEDMLTAVLADLKAQGAALTDTGFDEKELEQLLADVGGGGGFDDAPEAEISRAEELREKWGTALGQRWRIPSLSVAGGEHALLCGDSTVEENVERVVAGTRAQCCWTDPPFGVGYVGKTEDALTIQNDKLTGDALRKFLAACFSAADAHALQPGAALYIAHPPGPNSLEFLLAAREVGWKHRQTLVWSKDSLVLGHSDYHFRHELILFGYTPGGGRRGRGAEGWYGDNAQTTVFDVPRPKASEEHPTMKPPELVAAMVRNSCPVGGLVFEPFSGSGTTLIACEGSQRLCRAIELDPKFVAVALERLSAMGLEPALDNAV